MITKFANWLASHNKSYDNVDEYTRRQANWIKNNEMIHSNNKEAAAERNPNSVRFGHTSWSDLTPEEIR